MSPARDAWVVSVYFNPCRYVTKKLNFDRFSSRLQAIGANLLTIEMADADSDFELNSGSDVVRVRGAGLMWQKERLLNVAVAKLPSTCRKIIWLDCDVLFEDERWLERTAEALERYVVVQPFDTCVRLRRDQSCLSEFGRDGLGEGQIVDSFAAVFAKLPSLAHTADYSIHGHTGFAWAARREVLDACGFYDACLTGSADHLMAHVFAGALDSPCISATIGPNVSYLRHFREWAERVKNLTNAQLGCVPGRLFHLWHGDRADRRYRERTREFKNFNFDPNRDIRLDSNGLWEWADGTAAMRKWSHDMFLARNEDGGHAPDGSR